MKREICFTTGQFARLHHLNKRTLHFYDEAGLFSPACKGDNGYRYYTYNQCAGLENILALRELGMSVDEIRQYLQKPGNEEFLRISGQKIDEIEKQIRRLTEIKKLLLEKQNALATCGKVYDGKIEAAHLNREFLLLTPLQDSETDWEDMGQIMKHLQRAWECNPYKLGCGSYISIEKVKAGQFDVYDGLFSPVSGKGRGGSVKIRPEGDYLCGYCIGSWEKIPGLYRRMLDFSRENGLELTGECYEMGLNEFAISEMDEYVTQIVIQCRKENTAG